MNDILAGLYWLLTNIAANLHYQMKGEKVNANVKNCRLLYSGYTLSKKVK